MSVLDFRTKFFMTMVTALVCISGNLQHRLPYLSLVLCLFPFLLLLWQGKIEAWIRGKEEDERAASCLKLCWQGGLMLLCGWLLSVFLTPRAKGLATFLILLINGIVIRMLPGVAMGYYALMSTSMSDMAESLKRMHLPDCLVIPLSLMFRFFYSLREDYGQIREAMKMHGICLRTQWKRPLVLLEYRVVPLLLCASRCADDVAISAMSRGMVPGKKRSSISKARLRLQDYLFLLIYGGILLIFIRLL